MIRFLDIGQNESMGDAWSRDRSEGCAQVAGWSEAREAGFQQIAEPSPAEEDWVPRWGLEHDFREKVAVSKELSRDFDKNQVTGTRGQPGHYINKLKSNLWQMLSFLLLFS